MATPETPHPHATMTRARLRSSGRLRLSAAMMLSLALLVSHRPVARTAGAPPDLGGTWNGALTPQGRHGVTGSAASTLSVAGHAVTGTLVLDAGAMTGSVAVHGRLRGRHALLAARTGAIRIVWHGRWSDATRAWRGAITMRTKGTRARGVLTMERGQAVGANCGAAEEFAQHVMPEVFEPICAQCHVSNGIAAGTRFHVTAGDPAATALSAVRLVDLGAPNGSLVLRKPRAEVAHGGGQRIVPGSAQDQAVLAWVMLLASTDCQGGSGNGGGGGGDGGGGGGVTGNLYLDNCASCHGADGRGVGGRPDVHCNRDITAAVRDGRSGGPTGDMPAFPSLSSADVTTIQDYLAALCPVTNVTGADLFISNCAACHGADARGGPNGQPAIRCNGNIAPVVQSGRGTMAAIPGLANADIALIQSFLGGLCPPGTATGAELYDGNCATCHGATAGGTATAPSVRCATLVTTALTRGFGTRMPAFPTLSGVDRTVLVTQLATFCTDAGRTPSDLYAGNCASCHGATAGGGRNGRGVRGPEIACSSAGDYWEKMRTGEGAMPAFPALSVADANALHGFVDANWCR